jgi:hypothetical protein
MQSEQLLQERYFQIGNLIHVEHIPSKNVDGTNKGKLPDWTGIILPNQDWDDGVCHITAYSAETILKFRAMPYVSIKGTPITFMQQMINIIHERAKNIVFQPGIIDDKAITFPDDLRTNAYDHIMKLVNNSGMDFDVTGNINNNRLEFFINLYNRKGIDTSLELNSINSESNSPLLSVQGTPTNQVFGFSQAQTSNSRYTAVAINQDAYNDYGPLQLNQVYMGVHDATSVLNMTQQRANDNGRPLKRVVRNAVDIGNTLDYLIVGNTLKVKDYRVGFNANGGYGFEERVKILSVTYNDLSNRIPLVIEVI